jgi:hypothetical protein
MKFYTALLCTLLLAAKANAIDVNASTCNACTENQKLQRAISARQENHLSQQYVLDLVSGALNKYSVYLDSTCRPTKTPAKGPATNAVGGCGSYWTADEEVVEPELLEKGHALSTVFLYYGTTQAKVDINVADLVLNNPTLAGMDAFDYTNTSSYRNSLNESLIAAIKDQALGNLNSTLGDAIASLLKPLDRLFADGKIFTLDVTFKFADGSEVTIKVEGEHSFTVTETAQDANNNNVAPDAASAVGQTYTFGSAPTDYGDWLNYMRSLGVRISNGSGGGGMSCSSTIVGGETVVSCKAN